MAAGGTVGLINNIVAWGTDHVDELLKAVALLEYRLTGLAAFALCIATALGLHAVWGALDTSGRALIRDDKYLALLKGLEEPNEEGDLLEPLIRTEKVFRWAIYVWVVAGMDALLAMAIVPVVAQDTPTINVILQVPLFTIAFLLSARAWLIRMRLDRQMHRIMSLGIKHHRRAQRAA